MTRFDEFKKFRKIKDLELTLNWIGQPSKYVPITDEMRAKCEEMRKQHVDALWKVINDR